MFKNLRRGRQARNFKTKVPKILDLKASSEQMFSEKLKLTLGDRGTNWDWVSSNMSPRLYAQNCKFFHDSILSQFPAKNCA